MVDASVVVSVVVSVVSAVIAFVGLLVSAWAFQRSSPDKVFRRDQERVMRKLATQVLLMDYNMALIDQAYGFSTLAAKLGEDPELRQLVRGPDHVRALMKGHFGGSGSLEDILSYTQELAKRLDAAIEEALSYDLWGALVLVPPKLVERAEKYARLTVPSHEVFHTLFATFCRALRNVASLTPSEFGDFVFARNIFFGGVVRMVTVCQAYHRDVSSTASGPLVAALDASNGHVSENFILRAWELLPRDADSSGPPSPHVGGDSFDGSAGAAGGGADEDHQVDIAALNAAARASSGRHPRSNFDNSTRADSFLPDLELAIRMSQAGPSHAATEAGEIQPARPDEGGSGLRRRVSVQHPMPTQPAQGPAVVSSEAVPLQNIAEGGESGSASAHSEPFKHEPDAARVQLHVEAPASDTGNDPTGMAHDEPANGSAANQQ